MKICLVGPGIMPIPPNGWGAVEMLIWDYYNILTSFGHQVDIINIKDVKEIIDRVNSSDYDLVHLHYDVYSDIMKFLHARVKVISSHYPYISYPERYGIDGYNNQIINIVKNTDFFIFASSQNDIDTFCKFGAIRENTFLSRLGVKHDSYDFSENPIYDKTICFSQIVDRKRQYLIQDLDGIDFFGRRDDKNFTNLTNYKGELDRNLLNKEITKYTNFILLSSVENTTPLVVKEALICGLGVVVTEQVALELDREQDFITIIEEEKISDLSYIRTKIEENKKISLSKRYEIRKYGIRNFGIENILKNEYIKKIESLL